MAASPSTLAPMANAPRVETVGEAADRLRRANPPASTSSDLLRTATLVS